MTLLSTSEQRTLLAILLMARGIVPWPLRYSRLTRTIENWVQRVHLVRKQRGPALVEREIERLVDGFGHDCRVELLTGQISDLVALAVWTPESEVYLWTLQPATPAVLHSGRTYYLYRHPGEWLESRYLWTTFFDNLVFVQILGDRGSLPVPLSAMEEVQDWPHVSELPALDVQSLQAGKGVGGHHGS